MTGQFTRTMRGRQLDMGALAAANADKIAVGNAKMTARGDILGPKGVVLRTQEQVEQEWLRNQQRQQDVASTNHNIKSPLFPDRPKPSAAAMAADQHFEPAAEPVTDAASAAIPNAEQVKKLVQQRRKIVDTE